MDNILELKVLFVNLFVILLTFLDIEVILKIISLIIVIIYTLWKFYKKYHYYKELENGTKDSKKES